MNAKRCKKKMPKIFEAKWTYEDLLANSSVCTGGRPHSAVLKYPLLLLVGISTQCLKKHLCHVPPQPQNSMTADLPLLNTRYYNTPTDANQHIKIYRNKRNYHPLISTKYYLKIHCIDCRNAAPLLVLFL